LKKNRGYYTSDDISSILYDIQIEGITVSDIGLLFVNAVSNVKRNISLSTILSSPKKEQKFMYGIINEKKKEFQEYLRAFYNTVRLDIDHGRQSRKEVIAERSIINNQFLNLNSIEGTVEYELKKVLKSNEKDKKIYQKIGEAVISGALDYHKTKPDSILEGLYRIYSEYDSLVKSLKKLR